MAVFFRFGTSPRVWVHTPTSHRQQPFQCLSLRSPSSKGSLPGPRRHRAQERRGRGRCAEPLPTAAIGRKAMAGTGDCIKTNRWESFLKQTCFHL